MKLAYENYQTRIWVMRLAVHSIMVAALFAIVMFGVMQLVDVESYLWFALVALVTLPAHGMLEKVADHVIAKAVIRKWIW